jgi:hypothetical protein
MKYTKFSHKTPHLKGKQHQLDPNLDLKQLVHHATVQYVDRDADGDVDVYDNPKKKTPDENPVGVDVGTLSKKLIAKQKGELKHTKRGMAYEEKGAKKCPKGHYWCYTNKECKPIPAGFMVDPEGMLRKENGASIDEASKSGDSSLHDWFTKSKSSDGKPGWVQLGGKYAGKPCAKQPGQTTKPKCGSSKMKRDLSKDEEQTAFLRKNRQDPNPDRKGKAINVKTEAKEEIRYCTKCKRMEARNECSYGPEMWDKMTVGGVSEAVKKDHEYSMARSELSTIMNAAKRLKKKMGKGEGNVEAWVQSKITKAADYLDSAADYVDSGEMNEEKSTKDGGKKDACYHKVKSRYSVWPSAYASGALVKCRKVGADSWGNKSEGFTPSQISALESAGLIESDGKGQKCWKGYEKKGTQELFGKTYNRCVKKEEVELEEATRIQASTGNIIMTIVSWKGKSFAIKMFFPQTKRPSKSDVQDQVQKVYPGSRVTYYSISDYKPGEAFLHVSEETDIHEDEYRRMLAKERQAERESEKEFRTKGGIGAKKTGPKLSAVKKSTRSGSDYADYQSKSIAAHDKVTKKAKHTVGNPFPEEVQYEDWQKVNRQDKTDGLSQKAVNAYRRENPGSKLQTAVTEKNPTGKRADRRKNFCRRMTGMKKRLTSAKTARDPDSRINKALRRWNCN